MKDFSGLLKIAGVGYSPTVGDFMNRWNGDINANPFQRSDAFSRINNAGLDVKQPASRIPYVLGGGVLGRAAASYLGANPFWKNVATVGGAMVGNSIYKKNNPDPRAMPVAPGVIRRGW
jgi:hypothetical protein